MPIVLLVRHGQASFGAEDYDSLSHLGRRRRTPWRESVRVEGDRDYAERVLGRVDVIQVRQPQPPPRT
jgi:broad specificity phosphatase PhoE